MMKATSDRLEELIVGEDRRRIRVALLLAGGLMLGSMTVDYLALSAEIGAVEPSVFGELRDLYTIDPMWGGGLESPTELYANVLVVGLAAIHAYYNEGYLTSVLLASAPALGAGFWYIDSTYENLVFRPELVLEIAFPAAPIAATAGFGLGLGLRLVLRERASPAAESRAPGR